MNSKQLPVDEILGILLNESDPKVAFKNITDAGNDKLPSSIWEEYRNMDLSRDIKNATEWLNRTLDDFPETKGIYLGYLKHG